MGKLFCCYFTSLGFPLLIFSDVVQVREVSVNTALTQSAYMLFYVLDVPETQKLSGISPSPSRPLSATIPQPPQKQPLVNGQSAAKPSVKDEAEKQPLTNGHSAPSKEKPKPEENGHQPKPTVKVDSQPAPAKEQPKQPEKHNQAPVANGTKDSKHEPETNRFRPNGVNHEKAVPEAAASSALGLKENGWKVSDAKVAQSPGVHSNGWIVRDIEELRAAAQSNGTAAHKRKREDVNGKSGPASPVANGTHKTVNMSRSEDSDGMESVQDSDEEESAQSTEEEYEDQFLEDEHPAPKKQKNVAAGGHAPVFKWDEKDKQQQQQQMSKEAKKLAWEKAMRHEQYDQQGL